MTVKECNKEMKQKIKTEILTNNTWRCVKFFSSDSQIKLKKLTGIVLKTFVEESLEWPKENQEDQQNFIPKDGCALAQQTTVLCHDKIEGCHPSLVSKVQEGA
mmetsp:Transcript_14970/g.24214  ORF Transcript_14970/g.24214 Transcript_14970/m.24214 type:complete len:103 (-) Transcript_14970:972-1280(-)